MSGAAYKSFGEKGPNKPKSPVLELRVHGVRNSPPQVLLGCEEDDMEQCPKDGLGGYWSLKKQPASGPYIEAYSWGKMARNSPTSGVLGKVADILVRSAWFLVVPFGLSNAAYWSRRLQRTSPATGNELKAGDGAGTVRLFALALTLFYVTAFCTVFLDLLAVQCFPDAPGDDTNLVCSQLPQFVDGLATLNRGQRIALFSLAPLAGIVVLFAVSSAARVKYRPNGDQQEPDQAPAPVAEGAKLRPILATPGFWRRPHVSSLTGLLHVAGAISLIVILMSSDVVAAGRDEACSQFRAPLDPRCGWTLLAIAWGQRQWGFWPLVAGAVLLGAVMVLLLVWSDEVTTRSDNPDRRTATNWVLGFAVVNFAATLVLLSVNHLDRQDGFAGTTVAALLLLVMLTVLAVTGVVMRLKIPQWAALLVVLVSAGALFTWAAGGAGDWPLLVFAVLTGAAAAAWAFRRRKQPDSRNEAWSGHAPAIFMLFAVFVVAFLGSVLVHGVSEFLKAPTSTRGDSPEGKMWRGDTEAAGAALPPPETIETPPVYLIFGGTLWYLTGMAMLGMVLYQLSQLTRLRVIGPLPRGIPEHPLPDDRVCSHFSELDVDIVRKRRWSALAQRGEPAVGFLAIVVWAGLVVSSATITLNVLYGPATQAGVDLSRLPPPPPGTLLQGLYGFSGMFDATAAAWGLSLTGVLFAGAIVRGAISSKERPLSLLWDAMCFLPRAAHPFGPPCYADRVVPELSRRIRAWIESPVGWFRPKRTVLLSSHSLGTVLVVATLLHLKAGGTSAQTLSRIKLLSYGMQLRPYFGRLFPELLGPAILGTPPTFGANLWWPDPWHLQAAGDETELRGAQKYTLRALLDSHWDDDTGQAPRRPSWINLWRRTDYLGFPVHSYRCEDLDRYVDEKERFTSQEQVATHGNYIDTDEYEQARKELLA
ncbi:hypothetical protein [Arthrobacter cavernae]|uniref:Integral membrane protein n=1 Tax=Arthrobacter cavernae TaxID=2817681 RepID=A0A939HDL0_9MICC|nr:hypothetical protein [Arthrobacter cavernae]MBO1267229.1 hypothetical protein [Arthrobacter cavernae]